MTVTPSKSVEHAPRPIQVALARSPAPLILWLGMRLFVAEVALVVAVHTPGTIGGAVMLVALIVLAYAVLLAIHVLSLRLFVSASAIEARSLIWHRRYRCIGPPRRFSVTRGRGAFGTRLGALGIELGRGRLPSAEPVDVIRLASLDVVVLVPCDGIVLAISAFVRAGIPSSFVRGRPSGFELTSASGPRTQPSVAAQVIRRPAVASAAWKASRSARGASSFAVPGRSHRSRS